MDVLKNFKKIFKIKKNRFKFLDFVEILGYILSFSGLIYYISRITSKYYFDPGIVIAEHQRQSHEIPLPAITICSPVVLRSNLTNLGNYYKTYKINKKIPNLSVSEKNFLAAKVQMCSYAFNIFDEGTKNRNERSVIKLLHQGAPTVEETFPRCYAQYQLTKCNLTRSLTDLGMCYTFNMQSFNTIFMPHVSSDFDLYKEKNHEEIWTLDDGYSKDDDQKIPFRSSLGRVFHFTLNVNESDTHDLCHPLKNSFKFIFHLPNEVPTVFHYSDYVNFKVGLKLKISAVSTRTDKGLRKYSPEKRRCYFNGERKLQFFKSYTKIHCNLECLTNFTLRRCGCVHYSYPRYSWTKICDLDRMPCVKNSFFEWPAKDEMSNSSVLPCGCLPTCTMIEYKIKERQIQEISENASVVIKEISSTKNYSSTYAALNIEFGDFLIVENENFVAYTLENFIADCGGLLGLFLGFSFTSTIRFIRSGIENFKTRKNKVKSANSKSFQKRFKSSRKTSRIAWINDVENHEDFMTLLWWQIQARKRATMQGMKNSQKFCEMSREITK